MAEKKQVAKRQPSVFEVMAAKYQLEPIKFLETIKATVMRPGKNGRVATNEEIAAFLAVANKYNLDPFTNEIYAFPNKKGGIIPIVGIDGFVSQMNKNQDFNGMEIEYAEEDVTLEGAKSCPEWCEVKIYRKSIEKPIVVREYLDEVYVPASAKGGYPGPWQTHTKRMLRHKAIIQGARIGFGITGLYDEDEANRILEAEVMQPVVGKPEVKPPEALSAPKEEAEKATEAIAGPTPEEHNAFKQMLANFAKAKEVLGKEKYYQILGSFGYEKSNHIRKIGEGNTILSTMRGAATERQPGDEG